MTPWDKFFKEKTTKILSEKKVVIDIGGGLRVVKEKGNRYDKSREWIRPLLEKVDYKVLDPVPDYSPDIVGDIHALPLADNSIDAIFCIAVLEHVENPIKATEEMLRVLKPGGYLLVYVPFLYSYHAHEGYYKDFWRFTKDSLDYIFRGFASIEKCSVRGALATWIKNSPLNRFNFMNKFAEYIDKATGKIKTNQTSGYYVFLIK